MRPGTKGLLVAFAFGATVVGATVVVVPASAQQADQTNFLADVIRGSVAEAKLGQLAAERAQSSQVREYGDMLRKDHTKSLERASGLANEIGVPASSELTDHQRKQFESLQSLSGEEFDTTFLSQMVREHQTDIAKFSAQAQSGSDPEVMAFARDTLPTLQAHLRQARSIQSDLTSATKSGARAGSSSGDSPSSTDGNRDSGTSSER
jgi:putative membrane protein